MMLALALPATVGMIILRVPIIRVLYERGSFDANSTQMVAWALLWYAVGLTAHSLVEVLSRAFYAMHDTKTPVIVGVIAMSGNIALSFALSSLFRELGWMPLGGLALANSLATTLESLVLIILLSKRVNGLNLKEILRTAIKSLLASAVMGGVLLLWLNIFGARNKFLVLIGGLVIGVLVYALMIWLLKVPEFQGIVNRLKAMLKRKSKTQAESPD